MANEFFTNEFTSVLQKIVNEVVNDPATYTGSRFIPSVALPVSKVRTEVVEANGGLTMPHIIGTDPKYIQGFGSRVQEFEPPAYKEVILYDEKKILHLRELGNNDPSKRGIRQYISIDTDRLNRRLEARIEKQRWDAIFTGSLVWQGQTFSYGIPAQNRAVPLGQNWSTDGVNANDSANPLIDIRYWTMGQLAAFRKYKINRMIMNGTTASWILNNANTRAFIQNAFANPNINDYSVNQVLKFFIPGAPEVEIYNAWYQDETVVNNRLVAGDAQRFLPDGYIYFDVSLPGNEQIGEFVQTQHLADGTIDSPGFGKFLLVEECIAPGTRGGPRNPFIELMAGVYGGVKLDRPFDVLTAKVIP